MMMDPAGSALGGRHVAPAVSISICPLSQALWYLIRHGELRAIQLSIDDCGHCPLPRRSLPEASESWQALQPGITVEPCRRCPCCCALQPH